MDLSPPKFSVLIVNYNGGEFLQDAIDSLSAQTFRDFEVILVDNNSDDDSIRNLNAQNLPDFTLLEENENHGFAGGNNLAAKVARGEWLVLLNPDAYAEPDWLERIHDASMLDPDVNVFACAQISLDQPAILDGTGDAYSIYGVPWRGGFGHPISALPGKGSCFSPCGASAVYRRDVFLHYGGFDERFFCYCEDVDLGYRMQLGGESCVFLPDAIIRHKGSGTSGRRSYFTMYHGNRNRTWTYLKNTPLLLLILTLPAHLAIVGYIYNHNRSSLGNDGMRDGIIEGFRTGWKLRREKHYRVQRRRVSVWRLALAMAWNPFLVLHRKPHVKSMQLR
ncbi:MAG: glycosyltransferase family 2 protein [Pseudomonadota bacterium]